MRIEKSKINCFMVDKNDKFGVVTVNFQIGKSEDSYVTLAMELPDSTVITVRVCDLLKLMRRADLC